MARIGEAAAEDVHAHDLGSQKANVVESIDDNLGVCLATDRQSRGVGTRLKNRGEMGGFAPAVGACVEV